MSTNTAGRRRLWFGLGAVLAAAVALVFATIGDGVTVPGATGVRALLVDYGHTVVWVLLAIALGIAAAHGRWSAWAGRIATAALVLYLAFLAAVFLAQ